MTRTSLLSRSALPLLAASFSLLAPAVQAEPSIAATVSPGAGLYEVVVSDAKSLVYVASVGQRDQNNARVVALDPETLETKSAIDLAEPAFGLALNDKTGTLYTTNTRSDSISAIDLATGKVVATIKQDSKAHTRQIVVDPDGNRVFATITGRRDTPSEIWIIDGAKNEIVATVADLKGSITGLAFDAAGNRLFATAMESNEILEIDLADNSVKRTFPSGGKNAINVAYSPKSDRLFVTHQESGELTVLDAKDGSVVKTLPTGEGALGITLDEERGLAYVANRRAGWVSVIDTEGLEIMKNYVTGSMPNTVAVDPETGSAYVTNKTKSAGRNGPPTVDPLGDTVTLIKQ